MFFRIISYAQKWNIIQNHEFRDWVVFSIVRRMEDLQREQSFDLRKVVGEGDLEAWRLCSALLFVVGELDFDIKALRSGSDRAS